MISILDMVSKELKIILEVKHTCKYKEVIPNSEVCRAVDTGLMYMFLFCRVNIYGLLLKWCGTGLHIHCRLEYN